MPASYANAAAAINEGGYDAVWLQHEYGIFGGDDGEMVCDFVARLAPPLILTPHTVLGDPSPRQDAILKTLIARASQIMVMSYHSRDLLATRYGAPHELLDVIEHGAPDRPFGRQSEFKTRFGLQGRHVLTTFGLLGPGKGVEHVIEALPAIAARHPDVLYRVVGATHPDLVAENGESYRESLKALAAQLGVEGHVEWVDRFVETEDLLDQLEACDIYITPYPNLQQSTSGTLSYAVALGKAVIATPYVHARELLAGGVGRLIAPGSSQAIAYEVNALLDAPGALNALQMRAYAKGRETIWPRFADGAANLIAKAVTKQSHPAALGRPRLIAPAIDALRAMSDGTGMFQHGIGIVPDRRHGYCLDDNARALMLVNRAAGLDDPERLALSSTYASFIQHAWNDDRRAFRNFMHFDRRWCEEEGSEDSNGRALWALGDTIACSPEADIRAWAVIWYDRVFEAMGEMGSPRSIAFSMLGAAARLQAEPDHGASREMLEKGGDFLSRLLDAERRPEWAWFEAVLGYDNPRLPQALIEAGMTLGHREFTSAGIETLKWIAARQRAPNGHFRPIGSESFGLKRAHLPFDQQPLEAQAAIDSALVAHAATGDPSWLDHGRAAWNWFLGANDRGVVLGDLASGRCRDGIGPRGANANCGAESILAFQLGFYSMLALENAAGGDSRGKADGEPRAEPGTGSQTGHRAGPQTGNEFAIAAT